MKFGVFTVDGPEGRKELLGVVDGQELVAPQQTTTLLSLLREGGDSLADYARRAIGERATVVPVADAELSSPLPDPPTVRDFMTFEGHTIGGMGRGNRDAVAPAWWEIPTFYFTNPYAIHGPQADIPLAPGTARFDYEVEVAAVIGREGFNLTVEQAREHIAGYSLFIDWSARDIQMHEMSIGLGPAKGKDTASTLGPWFVTADEFDRLESEGRVDLELAVFVNGVERGRGNLSEMSWEFSALVAYASRGTWVRPGDVLGSGTCNTGCLAEQWGREGPDSVPALAVGDRVTVEAGILGSVNHTLVESVPLYEVPGARPGAQGKEQRL